jgi:hypothetical protein
VVGHKQLLRVFNQVVDSDPTPCTPDLYARSAIGFARIVHCVLLVRSSLPWLFSQVDIVASYRTLYSSPVSTRRRADPYQVISLQQLATSHIALLSLAEEKSLK